MNSAPLSHQRDKRAKPTDIGRVALGMCAAVLTLAALPGCGSDDDAAGDDPGQETVEPSPATEETMPTSPPTGSTASAIEPTGADHPFCDLSADISGTPSSDELQEVADSAPDEIKDDLQILVDALDDPANADAAALQEAAANLEDWGQENCE